MPLGQLPPDAAVGLLASVRVLYARNLYGSMAAIPTAYSSQSLDCKYTWISGIIPPMAGRTTFKKYTTGSL